MTTISLNALKARYGLRHVVEVTDKEEAIKLRDSEAMMTWGCGDVDATGWRQLAVTSDGTRYMCDARLLDV